MRIAILNRAMETEFREHGENGWTCYQLAREVEKLGHEVKVLTASPRVARLDASRLGDLRAWICPEQRRIPWSAPADKVLKWRYGHRKAMTDAVWLSRFVRSEGPFDVVWAMSEEPDALVCALAAGANLRVPYVVQIQALRYALDSGVPRFTYRRTLGKGFSRAALVVANSPMVQELLHDEYGVPSSKLAWLPPNLTEHFLSGLDSARRSTHAEPVRGRVVFLGAINAKKAPDVFLRAAADVAQSRADAQFLLIGGVTEARSAFARAWPDRLQAFHPKAALQLLGHLPAAEVEREVRLASVVVLPSRIDEFSRAAIECLALGVPVVVTSGVGAAYVVERDGSGLVVSPGDASALAQAIERVLTDDRFAFEAMRHAAAMRTEFSPATLARRWVDVLASAVASHR